jgi:hypothetical protein
MRPWLPDQAHTLAFLAVYAGILALPHTKWRDRLPAKPSFYRYILVLFGLNLLASLGAAPALCFLASLHLEAVADPASPA